MTDNLPYVRFAPSPTGELHLGGARTALFNWLFARHHGGRFHVRIEDTDKLRSKPEFSAQILESLTWLGLDWDGPLLHQSHRSGQYKQALQMLLNTGHAYRCFCSKDKLELDRKQADKWHEFMYSGTCRDLSDAQIKIHLNRGQTFTLRIRIPEGETVYDDHIYGKVKVNNREIDDFIIARSDGSPVYNLVVVVDDHTMGITHVIRGEDHISNTPKQILIYQALGYDPPIFAHLPMILGTDKKRLSKRHNAPGIQEFRNAGYPPSALVNYLVMLGWNPDTEQEIFTPEELVAAFRLSQVQKKGAIYDEKKLNWVSSKHLLAMTDDDILAGIRSIDPGWQTGRPDNYNRRVIAQMKPRVRSLQGLMEDSTFFYQVPEEYDTKTCRKRWPDSEVNELVRKYYDHLLVQVEWTAENIEWLLRETATETMVPASKLIHPVRLALTGTGAGPSLFALMEILGQEVCLQRLKLALEILP
ncbi:MAG: glutamate--tRNA ligase [Candidatus Marinimicrobia bacterium]|nr:glutamate--tRNA ligase [Candidatus Neomarinimicrobiota bacterium]